MSTPTKAIKELAEKIWLNATSHGHGEPIASQAKAIIALLADMEREGDPVKDVTTITGWVRSNADRFFGPPNDDNSIVMYEGANQLDKMMKKRIPATLIIHPSPAAADAMAPSLGVSEGTQAKLDRVNGLLAKQTTAADAPPDPDAHIADQDEYLKAKQERAKGVDFDGA